MKVNSTMSHRLRRTPARSSSCTSSRSKTPMSVLSTRQSLRPFPPSSRQEKSPRPASGTHPTWSRSASESTDVGLDYKARLDALPPLVASGKIGAASEWTAPHVVAISFGQHLYYPLLSPMKDAVVPLKMRPLALGEPSEVRFVEDVIAFF